MNARKDLDQEIRERRGEVQNQERRLIQKEENLERKQDIVEKKEKDLDRKHQEIDEKRQTYKNYMANKWKNCRKLLECLKKKQRNFYYQNLKSN